MSALLATGSAAFADLAPPGTLVVLDLDGMLVRMERDGRALPPLRTREAVTAVAERFPVALLSGLPSAEVVRRMEGIPLRWVIGSHGAEWPGDAGAESAWRPRVVEWKRRLAGAVARLPGVRVLDRGLSLRITYRKAGRAAAAAVRAAAGQLPGSRVTQGSAELDVVPEEAPDKGSALWRLAADTGAGRVFFLGDDGTDELAFRAKLPVPAVMVRVGRDARSAARYHVRRRTDVDRVLGALAELRRPLERRRGARP